MDAQARNDELTGDRAARNAEVELGKMFRPKKEWVVGSAAHADHWPTLVETALKRLSG
ncbi:MAG: hypothetical protein ABR569_12375 [Gaiellaceae bacterium]